MNALFSWLADPAHWSGSAGIPARLVEHLWYSVLALALGAVVALPIGALVGHGRRGGFLIVGSANGMRALPELGLLTLLVLLMGIGLLPVTLALAVLAIPPLLAGTYSGVRNVDPGAVDAARGMGMREWQVLFKVELPNALPLILGGLRGAALQVIATAAVAAYVSFGGLGRFLIDGLRTRDYPQMAAGAVLVAVLALVVEGLLALLQRAIVSPGLRGGGRRSPTVTVGRPAPAPANPEPVPVREPAGAEP
ncbi:ABC transporter permease [Pseudonocardia sp. RS11V-5]|uniref:ABC transporter permease n=1 Tax=Pseudonocardia terrae TaxID=2905831 RepID=UPI001E4C31B6|nr:ABC transporter permease [Pseudonocardia terrae]MCE3550264.1 ABC transporter permease [Pseudonocardia terrae]